MAKTFLSLFMICTAQTIAQNYYPLQVGNHWQYSFSTYWYPPNPGGYTYTRDVRVIGDTVMPNGKCYFSMSESDLTGFRFVRVDSQGIYYHNGYDREALIYKSDAAVGLQYIPALDPALFVMLEEIDTVEALGMGTVVRTFRVDGLILYWVTLSDKFGPIRYYSTGEPRGTQYTTGELTGAIIADSLYGVVPVLNERLLLPRRPKLFQNYPNPFNPSTTIRYELPTRAHVLLSIYDLLGQEVAKPVDEEKEAGIHEAKWSAQRSSSGVYIYRLQAGESVETRKMIIIR